MVVFLHCLLAASPLGPTITADASGAWGCGAYKDSTFHWFQVTWPNLWEPVNIAAKELFPFLVVVAVLGHRWQGSKLRFHSDNQAAVLVLNRGSAKDPTLVHLLCSLFFRFNMFLAPGTRLRMPFPGTDLTSVPFFHRPPNPQPTSHNPCFLYFWTLPCHGPPLAWKSLFSDCLNSA